MGLRVWASLSTKPRKGTSAQKHEKSKLTLSNTNQSVFVLHRDFHVQCLLFKIYPINQQRHSSLHKAAKILRSCSHTEAVSLSDLGIKYTSVVNPQTPQTPKNKDLIQNKKTKKHLKSSIHQAANAHLAVQELLPCLDRQNVGFLCFSEVCIKRGYCLWQVCQKPLQIILWLRLIQKSDQTKHFVDLKFQESKRIHNKSCRVSPPDFFDLWSHFTHLRSSLLVI